MTQLGKNIGSLGTTLSGISYDVHFRADMAPIRSAAVDALMCPLTSHVAKDVFACCHRANGPALAASVGHVLTASVTNLAKVCASCLDTAWTAMLLCAHARVCVYEYILIVCAIAEYLSFHPMAQCVVHALKGLA